MNGMETKRRVKIAVIGGGPAGLAAALSAFRFGVKEILVLERDVRLGGILNQCIHHGFGLHTFKEELTGPEYALRYIEQMEEAGVPYLVNTMVVDIAQGKTKIITAMNEDKGMFKIEANAIILAMGCRERSRGQLNIPGYRPAGIYAAGTAQQFVNMEGRLPGKEVIILGSGDIGLIMARRMTLQGAKVKLVAEIMPYSGGLRRNIVQCLDDYGIPLKLRHTITSIEGKERVKGVILTRVDDDGRAVSGTEEYISCDTLLISCGLIPENELSQAAGIELDTSTGGPVVNDALETMDRGIFACGNVLHVHDLVDNVTKEAEKAGKSAAEYLQNPEKEWGEIKRFSDMVKNQVMLPENRDISSQLICIRCPVGCLITVDKRDDKTLSITGYSCPRGKEYAEKEITAPSRVFASFVKILGGDRETVSVKLSCVIPKDKIFPCMELIKQTKINAPVQAGDIIIPNIAGTDAHIIATTTVSKLSTFEERSLL